MHWRVAATVATVLGLASGCFQERTEAPRRKPPAAIVRVELAPPANRAPSANDDAIESTAAVTLLGDGDPTRRREAVYHVADARDPNGAAIIGQALTDPDPQVRVAAIEALTGIEDVTAADWLSMGIGDPVGSRGPRSGNRFLQADAADPTSIHLPMSRTRSRSVR